MKYTTSDVKVSIIIVNFNCGELLTECLCSVLDSTIPIEVLVSDNGSVDGSIEWLESQVKNSRFHVERNNLNLGFSAGANRVMPLARGEYILFLNPDCLVQCDTLEKMTREIEVNPQVGMAGCLILILNLVGTEQVGCRRRVPTPWRTVVRVLHLYELFPNHPKFQNIALSEQPLPEGNIEVEAISGAFMLVRREAFEDVGLMDERYFLHCEDLDWCMRFRIKGWKILFVPDVEISHAKGECSSSRPVRVEWHKHHGMIRFYRKFLRDQYSLPLMLLVVFTVWLRFVGVACLQTIRRMSS
ncbi:MAG: glycosyltransferase family 2 protein [Mariprofundaceae bacterium]